MGSIFPNRHLDALAKTILFFGVTHIAVLTYAAIRGNVDALNAFNITGLNLVLPGLSTGLPNFILSQCMVLIVYLGLRLFLYRPAKSSAS